MNTSHSIVVSCQNGEENTIRNFLTSGGDPNTAFVGGQTLIEIASNHGHCKIINLLLEFGADINLKNKFGWTPLMQATREGHNHLVAFLLSHQESEANNKYFEYEIDLLSLAVASNCPETIDIIIDFFKNKEKFFKHSTALINASFLNSKIIVKHLLKKGRININFVDPVTGMSALMAATHKNNLKIVKLLIKHGADVNLLNNMKQRALDIALLNNNIDMIKYLKSLTSIYFSPKSEFPSKVSSNNLTPPPICKTCTLKSPQLLKYMTPKISHLYPSSEELFHSPYLIIKNPVYRRNLNKTFLQSLDELENNNSPFQEMYYSPMYEDGNKNKIKRYNFKEHQRIQCRQNWKMRCKTVFNRFQNYFFKKGKTIRNNLYQQIKFTDLIKSLNLDQFLTIFLQHEIDFDVFITLTKENLEEMGIENILDQNLILKQIKIINEKLNS